MLKQLVILLFGLSFPGCTDTGRQTASYTVKQSEASSIQFRFDRRVETVYFVLMLTGEYDILISRYPSSYKVAAVKYFSGYKNHTAVFYAKRLIASGFGFDYAANWIGQFSGFPGFVKSNEVNFPFATLKLSTDTLELFRKELTEFYVESNCDSFFTTQQNFVKQMISNTEKLISRKDLPAIIEDYYGVKKDAAFYVTLSPLMHAGGFSIECDHQVNKHKELIALIGPNGVNGSIPVFDKDFIEQDMIIHEFGHCYANAVVDANRDALKFAEKTLFTPVQENLENEGVGQESFMYELIVRAVTIRIVEQTYGKEVADQLLLYENSIGFKYVGEISEELKIYEAHRDEYPTFLSFFPHIINKLNHIKA